MSLLKKGCSHKSSPMSLNYTHLLIATSPQYRPEPGAIAKFAQGIIDNGNIPSSSKISFARVTKQEGRVRPIRNAMTGQTINIPLPSRSAEQPLTLSSASQIIEQAARHREYDVALSGEGVPSVPPCAVGYVENDDTWKPVVEPYHLEIRCRVRDSIVQLCHLENEGELNEPPDFAKYRPIFGEDCSANEREGIFVHPEAGAIRIPNAGCGTFWVEFNYGKFLFPRLKNNSVNVLDDSIISLARTAFGIDFVQACNWG
jgi:hypothetical protein